MTTRVRLSQTQWTEAALAAMAEQGTAGVNVEQLAVALGTTKGSFYHHFANRRALLDAALQRWEAVIIGELDEASAIADPKVRLYESALSAVGTDLDGFVDLALASSADDPAVHAMLERINARRMDFMASALADLGVPETEARARATRGLATYLGLYHLQRVTGARLSDHDLRQHLTAAVDTMTAA